MISGVQMQLNIFGHSSAFSALRVDNVVEESIQWRKNNMTNQIAIS
jgi:hypothetical protein